MDIGGPQALCSYQGQCRDWWQQCKVMVRAYDSSISHLLAVAAFVHSKPAPLKRKWYLASPDILALRGLLGVSQVMFSKESFLPVPVSQTNMRLACF